MKRTFGLLILVLAATLTKAQIVGEDFGRLSAADIDMKECSFDPEASAVVLLDNGSSDYGTDYSLISYYHIRIKILKQEGMKYADVSIPYYSEDQFEFLHDVSAMTINIDEKGGRQEYKVDKNAIYFKKINAYNGQMTFAFPQARVGSILEYKYTSTMKHYGGLRDWLFQSRLPVCFSSFFLRPAPHLEFTYQVQKSPNYPIVITPSPHTGVYFEMKNIPGLGNEPFMDSREDYVQKVRFQITKFSGMVGTQKYMSSWNEVAKQLTSHQDFGNELKTNLPEEQKLLVASIAGKSEIERMNLLFNYMRKNYQWSGFKGITAEPGLKALYSKKNGNSASVNLALVNLLKEAKLDAWPMIVSERKHGKINTKTPFLQQFNNTYAAVFIGGREYYLNATDPLTPPHLIPQNILNTTGLIVKRLTGILKEIQEENYRYNDNIYVTSVLDESGGLNGKVQLVSKDYARADRLSDYTDNIEKYIENLEQGAVNLDIDSLELLNKDTDTLPLEEKFSFKTGLQNTGDYSFLNLNMFTGFISNPFLTTERFSNINFGYKRRILLNNVVYLPPNFTVHALPKNLRLVNSDGTVSFNREILHTPGSEQLLARIKIEFNKSLYSVDEYPDVKEFFKKMVDLLNEQVVLKKK